MKPWFISDLHFGHFNVIHYSNRPFLARVENNEIIAGHLRFPLDRTKQLDWQIKKASLEYMKQTLINNWNSKISPEDLVYFGGDFAFLGKNQIKEILSQLNGYKILIKGNHDKSQTQMIEAGFNEVYDSLSINLAGEEVNLNHYPYVDPKLSELAKLRPNIIKFIDNKNIPLKKIPNELNYEDSKQWLIDNLKYPINTSLDESKDYIIKIQRLISRHIGTRLINEGKILLHGHSHSDQKRFANMINLSVEAWNYFPASKEEIESLISDYRKEINGDFLTEETCFNKEYDYYLSLDDENFKALKEAISVVRDVVSSKQLGKDFVTSHVPKNYSDLWYRLNLKYNGFIPLNHLEHGKFYQGKCRNAKWAYWDGVEGKFYYIREKFGSEFIESIFPIEKDNGYDLFVPKSCFEPRPEEVAKFWLLKNSD